MKRATKSVRAGKPNVKLAVPFFRVLNMKRSLRFYTEGLGFVMTRKWVDGGKLRWCWLELGRTALMLQEFVKEGHGGRRPRGTVGQGVSISFQCEDALALCWQFKTRGLKPSKPFVGNGYWVTMLSDPDGYKLEFESPTDTPEETVYEE